MFYMSSGGKSMRLPWVCAVVVAALKGSLAAGSAPHERRNVPLFNRITFDGNVVRRGAGHVDAWVVLFCVSWDEECEGLSQLYRMQAHWYERDANQGHLTTLPLRFAEVDCATDKVLCNEQGVDEYATVAIYQAGSRVAKWTRSFHLSYTKMHDQLKAWLEEKVPAVLASLVEQVHVMGAGSLTESTQRVSLLPWGCPRALAFAMLSPSLLTLSLWILAGRSADKCFKAKVELPEKLCSITADGHLADQEPRVVWTNRLPADWSTTRETLEL